MMGTSILPLVIELEGLLDQQLLAAVVAAVELDAEGLAEDLQGVGVGVQRAVDRRGDHALGIVVDERPA